MEARSRRHGRRRRVVFYGCSACHRKGKTVCPNSLTVPADVLEDAILTSVVETVLDPSVVEAAIDRACERIVGDDEIKGRSATLKAEITRVEDEPERLVEALARGDDSRVLAAAVRARERRRDELQSTLQGLLHREWTGWKTNQQVRIDLRTRISDWQGLLRHHPAQGQQILRKLLDGRLLMTPHADETRAYYEFEGTGTITGLLAGIVSHKWASPTGFEPVSQP